MLRDTQAVTWGPDMPILTSTESGGQISPWLPQSLTPARTGPPLLPVDSEVQGAPSGRGGRLNLRSKEHCPAS